MELLQVKGSLCLENPKNKKGEYRDLPLAELVIPAEDETLPAGMRKASMQMLQRNAVSKAVIRRMATNWDWLICQVLTVVTHDGKYLVLDGGHRLRAARLNGKIADMPCMVHAGIGFADAARAFLAMQGLRRNVNRTHRHMAGLIALDPITQTINEIVTSNGYRVGPRTKDANAFEFDAIAAFETLVRLDLSTARETFRICAEICGGDRIYKEFMAGVFELEMRSRVQRKRPAFGDFEISKLSQVGIVRIVAAINNVRAVCGGSGGSQSRAIPARAILDLLNKGKGHGRLRISLA